MNRDEHTSKRSLRRLLTAAALLAVLLLLAGCGVDTPQNTFAPAGDVARDQRDLFYLAMWPAVAILILVEVVLVVALLRYRRRREDEPLPKQTHGNTQLEIAWTIAPAVLLLVLAVPMVGLIWDLSKDPAPDALAVKVTGFQWNWQVEYPDIKDANGEPLRIIGACPSRCLTWHVPVGRQVAVELQAADVIHSFWIPRLAGKLDAIPGRTNHMWFKVNEPGSFSGQCAEFCGLGHADMRMVLVAETEEEFQAWVNEQLAAQAADGTEAAQPVVAAQGE